MNRPVLLLADEPTGNLDQKNAEDIMRLLERINGQGTTVLVVSHNQELVRSMHRRQVVLRRGQVARDLQGRQRHMGIRTLLYLFRLGLKICGITECIRRRLSLPCRPVFFCSACFIWRQPMWTAW